MTFWGVVGAMKIEAGLGSSEKRKEGQPKCN